MQTYLKKELGALSGSYEKTHSAYVKQQFIKFRILLLSFNWCYIKNYKPMIEIDIKLNNFHNYDRNSFKTNVKKKLTFSILQIKFSTNFYIFFV